MSRNITIYQFSELSKAAQKQAIHNMRNINTQNNWWQPVFHRFKNICSKIGIDVMLNNTYFTIGSNDNNGVSFYASVNPAELITGSNNKAYLQDEPQLKKEVPAFTLKQCAVDSRAISLLQRKKIEHVIAITPNSFSNRSAIQFEWSYIGVPNIEKQLCDFATWFEKVVKKLDKLLYCLLENEAVRLTSDEEVKAKIISLKCEFLKNGREYNPTNPNSYSLQLHPFPLPYLPKDSMAATLKHIHLFNKTFPIPVRSSINN